MLDTATSIDALGPELLDKLRRVPILASLDEEHLHCLDGAKQVTLSDGEVLIREGELVRRFWILLAGRLEAIMQNGERPPLQSYTMQDGSSFGEVPLLANIPSAIEIKASATSHLLELDEEQFWSLMMSCPDVRRAILGNMAKRLEKMQRNAFQQEKMATLGTMAAGLMHELNNPGTAARRAASQLRENLMRLHQLGEKFTRLDLTRGQKECMLSLQDFALSKREQPVLSTLEQSDREEQLAEWMESAEIEDAWRLAPGLVSMGFQATDLACARSSFSADLFNDSLNWLDALLSSQQLVSTIEESIGRVSDLVMAVKTYAYEGRGQKQSVDINKSIHATLVILGHKLREKEIVLKKNFGTDMPQLETMCQGVNQIWTNLLDNAIDASRQGGPISIRTWAEPTPGDSQTNLCIEIIDRGSGIPLESQPHIFDPFYTTKPAGVGTGLGLGIVGRIVEQFGGSIWFSSEPGMTEFIVRLPTSTGETENPKLKIQD